MNRSQLNMFHFFILILIITTGLSHKASANNLTLRPHVKNQNTHYIQPAAPHIASEGYVVIDADSGKIIAEKDLDKKRPPASLTKMMTVYVAFTALKSGQLKLKDTVTVSKRAWKTPGSKMFLKEGQRVSIEDLLKGIIVDSGNDASVALAEYIAGTEANFVKLMNKQAHTLGMENSHFSDSTGLPSKELYSTPKDLAILARALIKDYPEYYHWFKQKWFNFNNIKQPNRNRLLWRNPLVDGIKTGHTDDAGYALVASAKKNDMRLITVILGAPSDAARADGGQRLLSFGFRFYETHKLYSANSQITTLKVWKGKSDQIAVGIDRTLYLTIPNGSYHDLEVTSNMAKNVVAPIKKGQALGELIIKLNDKVISTRKLYALTDVEQGGLFSRLGDSIKLSFNRLVN